MYKVSRAMTSLDSFSYGGSAMVMMDVLQVPVYKTGDSTVNQSFHVGNFIGEFYSSVHACTLINQE